MTDGILRRVQDEQRPWVKHNFGDRPSWMPLLGVMEELGELAHAHLKREQGIRTNEDHDAKARDAVADIVIFLADYCSATGIDLESVVLETWEQVKQRDWKADPATAQPAPAAPKPRRMMANPACCFLPHSVEHNELKSCAAGTPCVPVDREACECEHSSGSIHGAEQTPDGNTVFAIERCADCGRPVRREGERT